MRTCNQLCSNLNHLPTPLQQIPQTQQHSPQLGIPISSCNLIWAHFDVTLSPIPTPNGSPKPTFLTPTTYYTNIIYYKSYYNKAYAIKVFSTQDTPHSQRLTIYLPKRSNPHLTLTIQECNHGKDIYSHKHPPYKYTPTSPNSWSRWILINIYSSHLFLSRQYNGYGNDHSTHASTSTHTIPHFAMEVLLLINWCIIPLPYNQLTTIPSSIITTPFLLHLNNIINTFQLTDTYFLSPLACPTTSMRYQSLTLIMNSNASSLLY